ncbi:hypothetical protein [Ichthyenterobacterium magnum]|uniref:Uncharacterized protein n=1 Tax=Ichthyenterobacterium magnum TaxID=1230530 RepID=A0A420DC76_9FLAO|nr:hypothetical protein [Ichthyenterobacterium magnum]RKE89441.1 hypothetical protein BXY80_2790 [Ichthyenterobacterium magnum]
MNDIEDEKDELLGIAEWNGVLIYHYESGKTKTVDLNLDKKD